MRLLQLQDDDVLRLVEYTEGEVPPYAILSHRWGEDEGEVTYKDVVENTGRHKIGYQKIISCGRQSAKDDYAFFWVDTCCIDKSSSAELSEAINSMWLWYSESKICYAYLNDVAGGISNVERDEALAASKWFTRGWTLQELLAPTSVVLFDATWNVIGTKDGLADRISQITNINRYYLNRETVSEASIAERMSWASTRSTKRTEDIAYCLLGIFDINMPLLYGEGSNAFRRLQEEIMKHATDLSILAWEASFHFPWRPATDGELKQSQDSTWSLVSGGALFAPSPIYFRNCTDVVRSEDVLPGKHHTITNRGLQIELPVLEEPEGVLAILNCRRASGFLSDIALYLQQSPNPRGNDQYWRASGQIRTVPNVYRGRAKLRSMYITSGRYRPERQVAIFQSWFARLSSKPVDAEQPSANQRPSGVPKTSPRPHPAGNFRDGCCVIQDLPRNYVVSQVYPPWSWSPQTCCIAGASQSSNGTWRRPRLVIISLDTLSPIAFMIFQRKHLWFETTDVRFVPVTSTYGDDIERLYRQWESADLTRLPRCQDLSSQLVVLRITPMFTRHVRLTKLSVVSCSNRRVQIFLASERIQYYGRLITYQYCLARNFTREFRMEVANPTLYLVVFFSHQWLRRRLKPSNLQCSEATFWAISFPLEAGAVLHLLTHNWSMVSSILARTFTAWEMDPERWRYGSRLLAHRYGPALLQTLWLSFVWGYSKNDPCVWRESLLANFFFLGVLGVARLSR
jgi:hypothetical protein